MGIIGSLIAGAINIATAVARRLAPVLKEIFEPLLTRLANAFNAFFRELGLLDPREDVQELGDKALQAEMDEDCPIRPSDYDLYSEYVKAVEKYKPDPELSMRISMADRERKGMELEAGLAVEKYGQPMLDLLVFVSQHPERFADGQWLLNLGKILINDSTVLASIVNYITHKHQSVAEDDKAFAALERIEREIEPDASDNSVWAAVKQRINVNNPD